MKYTIIFLSLFLFACSTRPPAPPAEYAHTLPWGAIDLDVHSRLNYSIRHSLGTALTQKAKQYSDVNASVPFNILTLSGGGSRGAFGAGLVTGWKERGDMPEFDIITGISTGSIMAPFIFLSDDEMAKMNHFYTEKTTEEVFTETWERFFNGGYFMNAEPLKKLFRQTFDKEFLDKVAQAHKNGRRLYVGTTNIDTGQLTVWDMGFIAASDRENKYELFSDIIYASAAMPVYLPPQYMQIDVDGESYYQMHIDGGIYSQVFMIGLLTNWKETLDLDEQANTNFHTTLYTIANRKYRQRDIYRPVRQKPFDIIEAYVLTEMDLLFDRSMYRLYTNSKARGIAFRMATIPEKMDDIIKNPTEFEPEKMVKLYDLGYKLGRDGIQWQTEITIDEYDANK